MFHPIRDEKFSVVSARWTQNFELFRAGKPDLDGSEHESWKAFMSWHGESPDPAYYRQDDLDDEELECFQIYENGSEGTPESPVFETLEQMEDWLVGGGHWDRIAWKHYYEPLGPLTREQAQKFCRGGRVPARVITYDGTVLRNLHTIDGCD
jgi:hypothetical protein